MKNELLSYTGLTEEEVVVSREKYGKNSFEHSRNKDVFVLLIEVVSEPMFLLLIVACVVYFLVRQYSEGMIMLVAMALVASISFFQERRSRKALDAVRKLSQPKAKVLRNGKLKEVFTEELVVNDIVIVEEGEQVPADGLLINAHDFSVDESILTGEFQAVEKNESMEDNRKVYLGTTVRTGNAAVRVTQVGMSTELGKLGKTVEEIKPSRSRFQKEIRAFVRVMAIAGILAFLLVFGVNFFKTHQVLTSLLFALALAMSILPEEIPVAFSTFMALGARRLLKENVLAKDPQVVETLGSATVICIDKTGTITENRMTVAAIYSYQDRALCTPTSCTAAGRNVIAYAMWSSEPSPFDPMEVAIHEAYKSTCLADARDDYNMIHEYPLSGSPPVMTHIYENKEGKRIIACKGGAESVIRYSGLPEEEAAMLLAKVKELASKGNRVLGVASAEFYGNDFPAEQKYFYWHFEGLIALHDPPKSNIKEVLGKFYNAGIKVKIVSGDFPETNYAIAEEIGFRGKEAIITGSEIVEMEDHELREVVNRKNIFARMFPDAKLKVVNALKANGEIVAMTGDGVNDGPALKAADIGVSMGSKGTEIAKRAASMVLLTNDLEKMFFAIITGRKIYVNLKKAIRYILSIHIAIITVVTVPLLLGWKVVNIFSPVHIIFFELVMGPTCSIIYENEPAERNIENNLLKRVSGSFLTLKELSLSIVQGLFISAGVLLLYYFSMRAGESDESIRTEVFTTISLANIFLTLENRSFEKGILRTLAYKNSLIYFIILITLCLLAVILFFSPLRELFLLIPASPQQLMACFVTSMVSVVWIELYKMMKR